MATPKMRAIRVHDLPWEGAKVRAAREGRTLSDVLSEFLEAYADTPSERRAPRKVTLDPDEP